MNKLTRHNQCGNANDEGADARRFSIRSMVNGGYPKIPPSEWRYDTDFLFKQFGDSATATAGWDAQSALAEATINGSVDNVVVLTLGAMRKRNRSAGK